MADILFWVIVGTASIGTAGVIGWAIGYFKRAEATQRAQEREELERMRADAKTREADIFAKPRGSKPDVIKRL